ncbi:MAG: hypothetical protein LKJ03_00665 [Enterococcaceae bacterium]|jgi:hypothetical protein|nr:hypothetical protein [Enterococcaceae bacterium]MCI1919261.1 hypothetical protein [Enterococcaceae bacterium]
MAQYSEKTAEYINKQINEWADEFFASSTGSKRDKSQAGFLHDFALTIYQEKQLTPKRWTGKAVREVWDTVLPQKIPQFVRFENRFGELIRDFLKFLDEKNYIRNASAIINALALQDTAEKAPAETEKVAQTFQQMVQQAVQLPKVGKPLRSYPAKEREKIMRKIRKKQKHKR